MPTQTFETDDPQIARVYSTGEFTTYKRIIRTSRLIYKDDFRLAMVPKRVLRGILATIPKMNLATVLDNTNYK